MLPKSLSAELPQPLRGDLRRTVSLVTKCTRALINAHFDTAQQRTPPGVTKHFYGAAPSLLSARRDDEGVSEADWGAYTQLWRKLSKGIKLIESSDATTVYG